MRNTKDLPERLSTRRATHVNWILLSALESEFTYSADNNRLRRAAASLNSPFSLMAVKAWLP